MPNTTNFNWPTPADTDLVKDGAAAIRNLGDGVDTSLVDLKGGTTGQILSKASNADMDFAFITPNVGDITEVQAGTGISVASGTGPIPVVTNSMATEITAKGDLIVGTGSGTFDNLPAGTNGFILQADSVETTGLKWVAPASPTPTFVGCSLYGSDNFVCVANTNKLIDWTTEHYDTDSFHTGSSSKIIIPAGKGGKYLVSAQLEFDDNSATGTRAIKLFKNGALEKIQQGPVQASAGRCNLAFSYTYILAAADELQIYAHSTVNTDAYTYDERAHFQVQFLGA